MLSKVLPESKVPALKKLLEAYDTTELRVWATGAPYDAKDLLKARGYRWNGGETGGEKAWNTLLPEARFDEEIQWLRAIAYRGYDARKNGPARVVVDRVTPRNRFSPRREDTAAIPL
jgi:DNA polymerase-3 subunit epsilon